jgi:AbrB family looped-hinge helix DNA binding protein
LRKEDFLTNSKDVSKVTSKNQVSIPKAIADRHGIRPGTELEFVSIGNAIRVTKKTGSGHRSSLEERAKVFDQILQRIEAKKGRGEVRRSKGRGWSREELYEQRLGRWRP